jgi:hypothetical protein
MRVAFLAVLILIRAAHAQNEPVVASAAPIDMMATSLSTIPAPDAALPVLAPEGNAPVPSAIEVIPSAVPDAPSARKFWTLENKINFSIFAGELAADAITTQRGLNRGMREANPLARPFVTHGAGGQAAASAIGFGLGVGTAYFLHRTHHYKAERIAVRIMLAAEGIAVGQNIAVLR